MPFIRGSIAEIMRSGQKDSELTSTHLHPLVNKTIDSMSKLVHALLHHSRGEPAAGGGSAASLDWMKWSAEIEVLTNLLYYIITTVSGQQTIGEEYVNIVQVGASGRHNPGVLIRACMVGLHCLGPYIVSKLVTRLRSYVNTRTWIVESRKPFINDLLDTSDRSFQWLYKLHRSLFFIGLSNENIAKLLTSVGYVSIRQTTLPPYRWFKLIGYLGIVQALVSLLQGLQKVRRKAHALQSEKLNSSQHVETRNTSSQSVSKYRCPLCYESYTDITCTPCGHLFCWSCVYPWTCAKSCCPVCREECEPRKLVLLVNFDL